jgi:hypothetical protein
MVNPFDFNAFAGLWWVGLATNFVVLPVCYAIGMYFLAPRLNANRLLWVVLALVPYVNWLFEIYVGFKVVFLILDNLAEVKAVLARRAMPMAEGEVR